MAEGALLSTGLGPIPAAERIHFLDVLRGAALFGILAANMRAFNSPMAAYMDRSLMWTGAADRLAQGFIDVFISGKFITLFSVLFGIGFAVQMDRAAARGVSPRGFYLRRAGVLLLFGLAHMFLLWWGDILSGYALMAFPLYLFRRRKQKTLLIWSVALYAWPLIVFGVMVLLALWGVKLPAPPKTTPGELARVIQVYAAGSYGQILGERMNEVVFNLLAMIFYYPRILGLFLIGLWVWRTGVITDIAAHAAVLRRCRAWGLAAGLAGNAAWVAIDAILHPDPMLPSPLGYAIQVVASAAVPALSLGYAASLALALEDSAWRARLMPFAAVGRTALSNYLLQTVLCTALFFSWGLGLFGKVGPPLGLLLTVAIYAAQVPLSMWWLRRHAFGPMEWLWRILTYGPGGTGAFAVPRPTGSTPSAPGL